MTDIVMALPAITLLESAHVRYRLTFAARLM
jgi:hypothetical protein